MAIIQDVKRPPPPPHDSPEPTAVSDAPPEYEEETPSSLPTHTPKFAAGGASEGDLPWWKRWLRSPIAIALVFLGCAVIATGVGLAVHFTRQKNGGNNNNDGDGNPYPYPNWPNGGSNGSSSEAGGPWLTSNNTYTLPLTTKALEFVSGQAFVDGNTYVQLAPPSQDFIGVNISLRWRQFFVTNGPSVQVTNNTMSIDCDYSGGANLTSYVFVLANITVSVPPQFTGADLHMSSSAEYPHFWNINLGNLTYTEYPNDQAVRFRNVRLEAVTGNIGVEFIEANTFNATTQLGNILGKAAVKGDSNVHAEVGNVFFVTLRDEDHPESASTYVSTGSNTSTMEATASFDDVATSTSSSGSSDVPTSYSEASTMV